ncbi:MAG TPA: hypothetical protein VLA19_23240 [Herpetosiphonaceae bacterium]|nr:hypothetical protein [Herpetosiphonaceae bacterium]
MDIFFCCTNLDLFSLDDYEDLARRGFGPQVVHCLGLCHYCALGKMAVRDGMLIVATDAENFLLVDTTDG